MGRPLPDDEDEGASRPRWLGWAIVVFMVLVVLGVLNVGWRILQPGPAAQALDAAQQARPGLAAGRALVEGSDCMRCHGLVRRYVGPSFGQIAARYAGRADAPEYLARKIREGGGGEWGRALMPRHPQITQAQALQMAQWLLAVPPVATTDGSP
ncbi:c-type cytochrome [Pulveribacter sp.]|uniref:c-type cytochrome n=1 Tax=Pulveribacter sp. TaxID=2678893 RepID=UPI00289DF7A5|nr:c-type cytochrome [Pulveribacter sp.]